MSFRRIIMLWVLAVTIVFAGCAGAMPLEGVASDVPPCHGAVMDDVMPAPVDAHCTACDWGHCCGGVVVSVPYLGVPFVPWGVVFLAQTPVNGWVPDVPLMPPKGLL